MGHPGHPLLEHSALKPFVPHVARPACQQAGDVAFHHGATRATGTGEVPLIRGAFAGSAGRREDMEDVLGTGIGLDRLDCFGAPHRQNAAGMEGLPHDGIIEPQLTRHRVYLARWACLAPL
jgi:hypothetical protein